MVPFESFCLRFEIFDGGDLTADLSNLDCLKDEFTIDYVASSFDSATGSTAFYKGKETEYTGEVIVAQSTAVSEFKADVLAYDEELKTFIFQFTFPSCVAPSSTPSMIPSIQSTLEFCSIDEFLGKSYFFEASELCFKADLFENGTFAVDFSTSDCSSANFNSDFIISHFDSATTIAFFNGESEEQYNGAIEMRTSSSVTDLTAEIVERDDELKIFVIYLIVPSCVAPSSLPSSLPSISPSHIPSVTPVDLVSFVGNPCTDQFPSGKCEICTGDCDRDSDCADGLRCAQRRETSGIENVPGCEWGPGSDSIRFDNDDFCKLRTCLFVVCFEGFLVWVLSQRVCFFRLSARFHTRSCELCWRVWFRLPMRTL